MSSSKLIVVTGQAPVVQSQVQAMLAEHFACCTIPLNDIDTLNKISKLAQVVVLLLDERALAALSHLPILGKVPTLVILQQPSTMLLQQVYQSNVDKILLWPQSREELKIAINECMPKKGWLEYIKNSVDSWFQPVVHLQKATFFHSKPISAGELAYQISLLGGLSIQQGARQMRPHTQREQELLGYLLFNYPRPVKREKLCAALWPGIDTESARNRLNVLIHRLRKGSGKEQSVADWLVFDSRLNAYSLNISDAIQIDLHLYNELLNELKNPQNLPETNIQICKKIVELHQGEFLEGIEHAEWIDRQRLDIREKLSSIILRLADYFLQKNIYAQAIYYCRLGVNLDPCLEAIQQRLVLAYVLNGDREAAIRAYRRFEQTRMQEFSLAPSSSSKTLLTWVEVGNYKALQTWYEQLTLKKLNQ